MEHILLLGTVLVIHFLAVCSPGPDFIVAVKNSIQHGRKAGIGTAFGITLANAVHISYCLAGLGIVISQSILLFNIFKFAGAAYLLYLGVKSLMAENECIPVEAHVSKKVMTFKQSVKVGMLTSILNPKVTLYFLMLFSVMINPSELSAWFIITMVTLILGIVMGWFTLVSVFFTQKKVQLVFDKFQGIFNKTFGSILIALGVKVALSDK